MGVNTNDPNFMQSMMNSPEVQQQMNQMLQDPAVIDQMVRETGGSLTDFGASSESPYWQQIAANPQLQQMGPYVRQMMQASCLLTRLDCRLALLTSSTQ